MAYLMTSEGEVITTKRNIDYAVGRFLQNILDENIRARQKFPSSNCALTALMEEVGELAQVYLKLAAGKGTREQVWIEAAQVASMAARVAVEGDPSIEAAVYKEP